MQAALEPQIRLTRAHLAIAARPTVVDEAKKALLTACEALTKQLGATVTAQPALREATLSTLSQLSRHAVFAIIELGNRTNALIEIDGGLVHALLQRVAGSADGLTLPTSLTRIEEAALGWLLLSILSSLGGSQFAARYAPKLVGLHAQRHEAIGSLDARRRHLAIDLAVHVSEHVGHLRFIVPALAVQSLIEPEPVACVAPAAESVLAARIDAVCLAGRSSIRLAQLDRLQRGDVVMFYELRFDADRQLRGAGRLQTKTFELRGDFSAPNTFTLTSLCPLETPMQTPPDPTASVDLEIELTRLRIPLHALGSLHAGTVLPLHINAAQAVTLRIGDKAVAKAELVDIEGEIGARILTLF